MISIIIPTKNEPLIQDLVKGINTELSGKEHEIIVVDKSSVAPKLSGAKLIEQKTSGLGNAFLEGFDASKGDIVVLMDGDGSHDPKDLRRVVSSLDNHEMAWGSKLIAGGSTEDSLSRRIVTLGFSIPTRLILWTKIKDPMSGMAAYRRGVVERVRKKLEPRGFKINLEIYYKSKPKTIEVPIHFRKRQAGESAVGWNIRGIKEFFRIILLVFELKIGRILGRW